MKLSFKVKWHRTSNRLKVWTGVCSSDGCKSSLKDCFQNWRKSEKLDRKWARWTVKNRTTPEVTIYIRPKTRNRKWVVWAQGSNHPEVEAEVTAEAAGMKDFFWGFYLLSKFLKFWKSVIFNLQLLSYCELSYLIASKVI